MSKRILTYFIFSFFYLGLIAQTTELKYKFYGFVENHFNYNSRKNIEGADGLVNIMPYPEKLDLNNKDLNEVPNAEMISVNSRLGVDIAGPDVFNAKMSAKIETDFAGFGTTYYVLRLRKAYMLMKWSKSELLVGQDWHPISGNLMPSAFGSNGGAPFNPFNRSPQLSYKYQIWKMKLQAAALYEMQYPSDGPAGKVATYAKNAQMPNFFVGLETKTDNWTLGLGADYKTICPRTESSIGTPAVAYRVNENLSSLTYMAYAQYTKDMLTIKAKAIYGQNLTNMLMIGGYAVSAINPLTGEQEYTNFNSANAWVNIVYGKIWKYGVFAGYSENVGTDSPIVGAIYGYGFVENKVVESMYRITPQISYNLTNWRFGLEYDMTTAGYGLVNAKNGKAIDPIDVTNHRAIAMLSYVF